MRTRAALLLALALAASAPAAEEATVALNFQDVELPVLAKFVSEVTGRNFIVDDRVRGKVTIISPTRITPDEAYLVFQSVLQVKGFTTVPSGAFTKIVPAREAVASGARRGDEVVTRILPLRHADAGGLVPVLQPLVSKDGLLTAYPPTNSLVVVDAGGNVERLGGLVADLDVPSSERATEVVTLRFAPADETARRLRDALGGQALRVTADARTNALVLSGPPDEVRRARAVAARLDQALPPGSTRVNVYRLRYAAADGLVRVLAQLVGQKIGPPPPPEPHGSSLARSAARRAEALGLGYDGGMGQPPPATPVSAEAEPAPPGTPAAIPLAAPVRLTADPATNSLIVSATPADWETLRGVIEQLDVRRRQVFVEAIILEATAEKTRALGVEFRVGATDDGHQGLAQANLGTLAGALVDPTSLPGLILAAASNQKVKLPNGQEVPAHTVLLTALQTDSDVNVLSAPNIITTDNEEAEIVVGRNVPFVASRATSASNLANLFTTVERHDVGITLRGGLGHRPDRDRQRGRPDARRPDHDHPLGEHGGGRARRADGRDRRAPGGHDPRPRRGGSLPGPHPGPRPPLPARRRPAHEDQPARLPDAAHHRHRRADGDQLAPRARAHARRIAAPTARPAPVDRPLVAGARGEAVTAWSSTAKRPPRSASPPTSWRGPPPAGARAARWPRLSPRSARPALRPSAGRWPRRPAFPSRPRPRRSPRAS